MRRSEAMHLMYYMDADGKRVYTLTKAHGDEGKPTTSAHPGAPPRDPAPFPPTVPARARAVVRTPARPRPDSPSIAPPFSHPPRSPFAARFSPDDKFSSQRIACKKRFGLLLTQQPAQGF